MAAEVETRVDWSRVVEDRIKDSLTPVFIEVKKHVSVFLDANKAARMQRIIWQKLRPHKNISPYQ